MFPYSNDFPTFIFQLNLDLPIPLNISLDFILPKIFIIIRNLVVFGTTMPKATIYEYS